MMLRRVLKAALALAMVSQLTACQVVGGGAEFISKANAPAARAPDAEEARRQTEGAYLIQPGDELALRFFGNNSLNHDITVQPDGAVVIPLLGARRIAGLTLPEVTRALKEVYSRELRDPEVAVQLIKAAPTSVYVGGGVQNVGEIEYRRGMNALDAVLAAGGPSRKGRIDQVLLIRKSPDGSSQRQRINLQDVIQRGTAIPFLEPWDVVMVAGAPN